MRTPMLVAFAALAVPALLAAQYGYPYPGVSRTRGGRPTANTGPYGGPAVTFHGKLKQITSKELVIVSDDDQEIVLRRTHKTKFLKGEKEIKPAAIHEGAPLTIDVSKDPEMKPVAVNVFVDLPKPAGQPSAASAPAAKETPR